ncbi:MAG TPA: methyltransferase domain-containing protein [Kiritimatiellia bacterium]|nr:methyltransferase domain-containing protein [Kiritimatiellia bacterium]
MKLVTRRKLCRCCGSRKLELVVQSAPSPLPSYVEGGPEFGNVANDLFVCTKCGHIQNTDVIIPGRVYPRAPVSSDPQRDKVLAELARAILKIGGAGSDATLVDIGSGDGSFLAHLKSSVKKVQGIEPSLAAAKAAEAKGIATLPSLFDAQIASKLRRDGCFADVVTVLSVVHLMDNLQATINCIRYFLKPGGLIVMEAPDALSLFEHKKPAPAGHGRLSFYSLHEWASAFERNRMTLIHAERTGAENGSLLCFARDHAAAGKADDSVKQLLAAEDKAKLNDPATWRAWARKA